MAILLVCLSVTIVRIYHTLAKIKSVKMTSVDVWHLYRMASLRELCSVNFIFDFKCLKYVKFVCVRILPEAKIMK